jgi:hypothetical protein
VIKREKKEKEFFDMFFGYIETWEINCQGMGEVPL